MPQLESVAISDTSAPTTDLFGAVIPKLAALLDLPASPSTLLIGESGEMWQRQNGSPFDGAVYTRSVSDLAADGGRHPYDLIIWSYDPAAESNGFYAGLQRIRRLVGPTGTVLLQVPNRLSIRRLRRQPASALAKGVRADGGYRRSAFRAGFGSVERYLPLPDLSSAEEYVAAGEPIDLPSGAPAAIRLLNSAGALPHLHTGYCYHLAPKESGVERLLTRLSAETGSPSEESPRRFRLQRYALRRRGALILTLASDQPDQSVICRITTAAEIDRVVRENGRWVEEIAAYPALSQSARDLLPNQLGTLSLDGSRAYLEEKRPGVIGWKFASEPILEPVLFAQSVDFLDALHIATRRTEVLSTDRLAELLEVPDHPWYGDDFADLLEQLRSLLIQYFVDQRRALTVSHGDYGYGNLLVEPEAERVSGIIDWDQARVDLAGVDLINFLIQRRRMTARVGLVEAMRAIAYELANGAADTGSRVQDDVFVNNYREERLAVFGWSVWRFVERDTRYQSEYEQGRDTLKRCVSWLVQELSR